MASTRGGSRYVMKMSGLKEDSLRFGNTGYWTEGQRQFRGLSEVRKTVVP